MNAISAAHCFSPLLMDLSSAMLFLDGRFLFSPCFPIPANGLLVLFPEIRLNGYVSMTSDSGS